MNVKDIRLLLEKNMATVGTWLQFPSSDVAEIMARAGYDWVAVDMEHGSFSSFLLPDIFRAIECGGAVPFARLAEANKVQIKYALESGAQGIIFPMIESAEQLSQVIDWAIYPGFDTWRNNGEIAKEYRGVGYCRANLFGKYFEDYRKNIASDIFLVAQIEHIRAVDNLESIVKHKRLDAIMVGPYDLSGSMGITGEFDNPKFISTMEHIKNVCQKCGMRMGLHIVKPDPEKLNQEITNGSQFIAYGIDSVFLWSGAERPKVGKK